MNDHVVNAIDQVLVMYLGDLADELGPAAGVAAAAWPPLTFTKPGSDPVTIELSDKASATDPHSDGALWEIGDGYYFLDAPDALFTAAEVPVVVKGRDTSYEAILYGGPLRAGADLVTQLASIASTADAVKARTDEMAVFGEQRTATPSGGGDAITFTETRST